MAELTKLLLIVLAIHVVLTLAGVFSIPGSTVYQLVVNPGGWNNFSILEYFTGIMTVAAGFVVAGGIIFKNDFAIFGGISLLFLSFGAGLAELFRIIASNSNTTIAIFFVSPIILIYLGVILAFWRGRA